MPWLESGDTLYMILASTRTGNPVTYAPLSIRRVEDGYVRIFASGLTDDLSLDTIEPEQEIIVQRYK